MELANAASSNVATSKDSQSIMPTPKSPRPKFRDVDVDVEDVESRGSRSMRADEEIPPRTMPKWYKGERARRWANAVRNRELRSRYPKTQDPKRKARRRKCCKRVLIVVLILAFFGIVAGIIYVSFVAALIHRLNPPSVHSGLQHIVEAWKEPDSNGTFKFDWRDDFSRDIVPKNCHSHNDYWRSVPLYEALAAGCVSVEADVWSTDDNKLLVSHSWGSTSKERTLRALYLDPLTNIFTKRNVSVADEEEKEVGMFDADPNVSTVLLIDFKNDGRKTWSVLLEQLRPLREKGWLTYFNGEKVINGPLTIVGTGNTPFDLVQQNNTNRFIFYDAPLNDISNAAYNSSNSYYASVQLRKVIGHIWLNKLSSGQTNTVRTQIKAASDKGLKSRYWGTPSWPISLRDNVWFTLTENEVGVLNVDDLVSATRWNWNWCVIAGLELCGHR